MTGPTQGQGPSATPPARGPALANGQQKKLVIKPLKLKPQLPADFEAATWRKLSAAVAAVHEKTPVATSLEELYRAVEDMCLHKLADRLYECLRQQCDTHLAGQLALLRGQLSLEPLAFLHRADETWRDYCDGMLTIRSIFLYLDRTYVLTLPGIKSLFDMGLALLRGHLTGQPEVEAKLVSGLLALIERERHGESVPRALLKSLLRMFDELGSYPAVFEAPFLAQARDHYAAEGDAFLAAAEVPDYLQHCENRLSEEYERCAVYLAASTRKPLIGVVEAQLVARHVAALLERGFADMVEQHRVKDLARLYGLCGRVLAHEALKASYKEYIKAAGLKIVKDEEKDKDMVERLLSLKQRLDEVLDSAFARNEAFGSAQKEAFESFINQRQNKPAELIAKFIDSKLKAGNKGASDDELEATLDRALLLFRFIQGKDVFEAFYKKDLAKRLLLGKSASIDAEKSMISKLKAECGSQFTNKLEGMFKDVDLSKDIGVAFMQAPAVQSKIPAGVDIFVHVLTSGFWPSYPISEAALPEEMATYQAVFREFYLKKHSGRQLVWHNSLGTCVLKARFPKGAKELSVSLFQAVVLMLFNDADRLSFPDLKAASGIEDAELRRTLQSLACGKLRVLRKEPAGKDVADSDVFAFNDAFSEKLFRIKINSIQLKETEEENKKTNEQVAQDRQYQIDACVVRIMKTRKSLSHKLLVAEAMQQLKFPLRAADLKKRIESLIDREYLERDNADPNIYNYLA